MFKFCCVLFGVIRNLDVSVLLNAIFPFDRLHKCFFSNSIKIIDVDPTIVNI